MGWIDSKVLQLRCPDAAAAALAGPGRPAVRPRAAPGRPVVELPARPGRAELDPVLAEHDPRRLIVSGTDADLAAVLVRLLRTDRLDVEVAYLPAAPDRRPPRPGGCRPARRRAARRAGRAGRRRCR